MSVKTERDQLIKEIEQVEDIQLLHAIKTILHYGLQREGRITLEQYNLEIEEAERRIENGEFIVHEDAIKQMKGWRKSED
jgi:predicted transcriptional regulator